VDGNASKFVGTTDALQMTKLGVDWSTSTWSLWRSRRAHHQILAAFM